MSPDTPIRTVTPARVRSFVDGLAKKLNARTFKPIAIAAKR
jgi:hypothetical protein